MVSSRPVLKLPSTLLHAQADACLSKWLAQLPQAGQHKVEVDASDLVDFDSSALAVLLALRRAVTAQGGSLKVLGMSARLHQLANLYGVLDLLEPA